MNPDIKKLLGQAIVRAMAGDKGKAAELSSRAQEIHDKEVHLYVRIGDILSSKAGDHQCEKTIML